MTGKDGTSRATGSAHLPVYQAGGPPLDFEKTGLSLLGLTIQLSKSKERTGRAIIGARVAPSGGKATGASPSKLASLVWSSARVAPQQKEETQRLDLWAIGSAHLPAYQALSSGNKSTHIFIFRHSGDSPYCGANRP